MRRFVRLMAGAVAAASVAALTMAPAAMADPPSGKTVHNFDLSGIGADTTQSLFDQFSEDYNAGQAAAHKADSASNPYLYSWDATNPTTQAIGDSINLKKGCAALPRPDGSSAGVVALTTLNKSDGTVGTGKNKRQTFCIDYVRSARNRATTDPPYSKGGLAFITLAGDAVTYATQPGSAAPSNLTTAAAVRHLHLQVHQLGPGRRQERSDQGLHPAVRVRHQDVLPVRDRHPERRLTRHLRERRSHQEESGRSAAAERGHQRAAQQGQAGRDLPVLGRQVPRRGLPLG